MTHRSLLVFDIETVPDTDALPNLTGFEDPDVGARRAELERYHLEVTHGANPFPRQPFHRVVAIAFLEAEIQTEGGVETYLLRELRSGGEANWDEKKLIQGFFAYVQRSRPRLVSFNGRTFDLPVLRYRAMVHGITAPYLYTAGDKWDNYMRRYSPDWHCDLLDVLSDYGASARVRLNEVCAVLGLPGKFGIAGGDVAGLIDAHKLEEVRRYCETDVLNTYLVYLRHRLHTGGLALEGYNRAVGDVIAMIQDAGEARPHLGDFLLAWEQACGGKYLL